MESKAVFFFRGSLVEIQEAILAIIMTHCGKLAMVKWTPLKMYPPEN